MRTIEQIKENKTFYKRNRDVLGNLTREPYLRAVPRKVKLVTGWLRFAHYIIDYLIISLIIYGANLVLFEGVNFNLFLGFEVNGVTYNLMPNLISIILTVIYYFICEKTLQRTIGKYASNSVVINQYADFPDDKSLIVRSFSRVVPFEIFSCLSDRGWHDKWSKTYVVTIQERNRLKKMLNEQQDIFISENQDLLD